MSKEISKLMGQVLGVALMLAGIITVIAGALGAHNGHEGGAWFIVIGVFVGVIGIGWWFGWWDEAPEHRDERLESGPVCPLCERKPQFSVINGGKTLMLICHQDDSTIIGHSISIAIDTIKRDHDADTPHNRRELERTWTMLIDRT